MSAQASSAGAATVPPRAVHQVLPALHAGDAVGNEALALRGCLRAAGFASDIFAGFVDPPLVAEAHRLEAFPDAAAPDTVTLFHFGAGSPAGRAVIDAPGALVVRYHNITPPELLARHAPGLARTCIAGRDELRSLAPRAALGLGASEYNRRELEAMGFARTAVLPLAIDLDRQRRRPSVVVRKLFADGRTNVLSVGRLAPNTRLEDVIAAFAVYQRLFDPRARLLLVGSQQGFDGYVAALLALARSLRAERVVFAGHVGDEELAAHYETAHALLCLSRHEGFGAPLVEAMVFDVPVVARDEGAVAETLDGAGILLPDPTPEMVARVLDRLRGDARFREAVLVSQRAALARRRAVDYQGLLLERLGPVLGPSGGAAVGGP